MTEYRYMTAAEWGMRWARAPQREVLRDPECYVHHVGGAAYMDGDAAAVFRWLNEYAINSKGYSALDYDVLVHYDRTTDVCTIAEGRGDWMSAATRDRNEEGEAVVLCGNTQLREPHPAELEGIAQGIVLGIQRGWIAPDAQILGHRDNPAHPKATACPGDYLYAALPQIRARVAELLAPPPDEGDDMTPEQARKLDEIHAALLVDDAVMPGYPSLWTMANQTRSAVVTLWDGFPGVIRDGAGSLARTIRAIAGKVGARVG